VEPGGWFRSKGGRIAVAFLVFLLVVLAVLAFMGFHVAFEFLVLSVGALVGGFLAYLVVYPFRRRISDRSSVSNPFTASFLGMASSLAILLGALFVGFPASSSDKGGVPGALVPGFAIGFGSNLQQRLSPPPRMTPEEARERKRDLVRGILIVGGALLVFFGLTFTAHVLLEYVIGPLFRFFA
jgi:hypothetical protein